MMPSPPNYFKFLIHEEIKLGSIRHSSIQSAAPQSSDQFFGFNTNFKAVTALDDHGRRRNQKKTVAVATHLSTLHWHRRIELQITKNIQ